MKTAHSNASLQNTYLIIAIISVAVLYATKAGEQTRDSLVYAFSAQTGQELFHPHHLIYTPVVRLLFRGLSELCASCDAIFAAQIHNITWAALGVVSFFAISRALLGSSLLGLLAALLLLVVRGFWELSTQATMYVPAAAILILLVAVLLVPRQASLSRGRTLLVAFLFALGVLYHQSNVLFLLPLGYYFVAKEGTRGWKTWAVIMVLAGGLVLAFYVAVFLSTHQSWSLPEFVRFCLAYTQEVCLGGQCKVSPKNWGTLKNLSVPGALALLHSLLWTFVTFPEAIEPGFLPVFGLFITALCLWHVLQIVRSPDVRPLRGFLLVWVWVYALFFLWWLPEYEHPFVVILAPILLLGLLAVKDLTASLTAFPQASRVAAVGLVVGVGLLAARNFDARIGPLQQPDSDSYREAAELNAAASDDCVFLTSYRTWNHLRYYFNRENAIQAKHPLSYFYQGLPLPAEYDMSQTDCIFVQGTFLSPDYVVTDYNDMGDSGYSAPLQWLAYMAWLFGFEYDDHDTLVASRDFETLFLDEDIYYLRLTSTKTKLNGLSDLFQRLDEQIGGQYGDGKANPFQSWLATSYKQE